MTTTRTHRPSQRSTFDEICETCSERITGRPVWCPTCGAPTARGTEMIIVGGLAVIAAVVVVAVVAVVAVLAAVV